MPAADVQYVLDHAVEYCQIGGDTYHYVMELCPNPNALADQCEERERRPWSVEAMYHCGADTGEFYENSLIDFRKNGPEAEVLHASFMGLRTAPRLIKNLSDHLSFRLADDGFKKLDRPALIHAADRLAIERRIDVLYRSFRRAASDFAGWDVADIHHIGHLTDRRSHDQFMARRRAVAEIKARLKAQDAAIADHIGWNSRDPQRDIARATKEIRERMDLDKRIIKRSVKLFSKLFGSEMTRMFIGGENIRVEGQHAIYEFRRMSKMTESHGGFRALSVFHKDHPDLLLCDVCIYTSDVPLLDHIASLIIHIKAGEEDEILKLGNPQNVTMAARNHPHISQFMPPERSDRENLMIPDRKTDHVAMRQIKRDALRLIMENMDTETARLMRAVQDYSTVKLPNHYTVTEHMYPELQHIPIPTLEGDVAWVD